MNFLREWMWHGDIYIHNRHPTSAGSICLPASSFVLQRSSSALLHVLQPDNVCICVRASVWVSGWLGVLKCVCVSVEGHVQVHPSFQDRLCLLLICAFSWCTSAAAAFSLSRLVYLNHHHPLALIQFWPHLMFASMYLRHWPAINVATDTQITNKMK